MKLRLLPSTFESDGSASSRQHYSCFVIDGCVAMDAGSLANGVNAVERERIRDVVLTHAHLDHIAGLPLFIDDLFPTLTEPIRVYATQAVIDVLESHIFNWSVYPRFSELKNWYGDVIEYCRIENESDFDVKHLRLKAIEVNHKVPASGFVISDNVSTIAFSGDTAEMVRFWEVINDLERLDAVFLECAFPDEFSELAAISHHLTPSKLATEIDHLTKLNCPIYAINLKPAYRDAIEEQLRLLKIDRLEILEVGREHQI